MKEHLLDAYFGKGVDKFLATFPEKKSFAVHMNPDDFEYIFEVSRDQQAELEMGDVKIIIIPDADRMPNKYTVSVIEHGETLN